MRGVLWECEGEALPLSPSPSPAAAAAPRARWTQLSMSAISAAPTKKERVARAAAEASERDLAKYSLETAITCREERGGVCEGGSEEAAHLPTPLDEGDVDPHPGIKGVGTE